MRNLTDYEKKTGWRYSITCTNTPGSGIGGVPGSHHPQYIDVVHREHACVETAGVRTAKAMGLRALPSKTWQVNKGWVIAANIAADLAAWTRLLGHHDDPGLREANPDTLRYRVWHLPARLTRHARQRTLAISPDWPGWCGQCAEALPADQHEPPARHGRRPPRRGRSRRALGHTGQHALPPHRTKRT
jgi:Transposase DDE domain group 1